MDSSKHIDDITGYKKGRVYGGADLVPGVSKNALQLDGLVSTGVNLGNFSFSCLSEPSTCKTGFTITLWIKLNTSIIDDTSYRIIFQVSRFLQTIGTTLYAKKNKLGLAVNDQNTSRTIEIAWKRTNWTHVSLVWNKIKDDINIFLDCTENKIVKKDKVSNVYGMIPPQNQMWLGSNYAMMSNCKIVIDELAVWYQVLNDQEICYTKSAKQGNNAFDCNV